MANIPNDTELKPDVVNKKAKAKLGYEGHITIGGSDPTKFVPNINVAFKRRIEDEYFLNINDKSVLVTDKIPEITKKSKVKVGKRTDQFYVLSDGTLEYEIIFDEKPSNNKIKIDIDCSEVLKFWHQPELTQDEIDDGAIRPENVVNSYAVMYDKWGFEYPVTYIYDVSSVPTNA